MKHTKDLSWLSAPAFFLILGMMVFNAKKSAQDKHTYANRISAVRQEIQKHP